MLEPAIKVHEVLIPNIHKDTIERFLHNPQGYITVDLAKLWHINPGGLVQFLEAASKLENTQGNLQFVNVSEDRYIGLMNTNISGRRLIRLAEIYTKRTETEINSNLYSIVQTSHLFDTDRNKLIETIRNSEHEYDRQHRGSLGDEPDLQELERRKNEYGLIQCIRLIEEQNPNVICHLGYRYGKVERIMKLDNPNIAKYAGPRNLPSAASNVSEKKSDRKIGMCVRWFSDRGFGFLSSDGTDVFVHITDTHGYRGCEPGKRYTYDSRNYRKGTKAVNVTPLSKE